MAGPVSVDVQIQGITPLLCNRYTDASALSGEKGSSAVHKGDAGTPRAQAEVKLYTDESKKFVIPQPNVFSCLMEAGKFFKLGKNKITTNKSSLLPACVTVNGIAFPIEFKRPWEVDSRRVVNPHTGGCMMCHRPSFHDWKIRFTLEVDTDMISTKVVREIVDAAGKKVGLGDFRPARKGPFGQFVVVSWKETAAKVKAAA